MVQWDLNHQNCKCPYSSQCFLESRVGCVTVDCWWCFVFQVEIYVSENQYLITLFSRVNKFFLLNTVKSSQYSKCKKAERERERGVNVGFLKWCEKWIICSVMWKNWIIVLKVSNHLKSEVANYWLSNTHLLATPTHSHKVTEI